MADVPVPDDDTAASTRLMLHVGGLVPFTSTDFPGKLAAVIFCQGCPWRCGYCHNPHLLPARGDREQDWNAVLAWLDTRRGLLDGVVFSGGEPTAQAALGSAMRDVRAKGYAIGLHTGGIYPRRLADVLDLVDWVGIDIKAPVEKYGDVTGVHMSGPAAFASLEILMRAKIPCEVRTTVHRLLTPAADLRLLASELAHYGVRHWKLQMFRPVGCANGALIAASPHGEHLPEGLIEDLRRQVPEVELQ
jgi:pyruvate formate lyase activating enzyme